MSYDLHFYQKKESGLTREDIAGYLSKNLVKTISNSRQWDFKNEDTMVY